MNDLSQLAEYYQHQPRLKDSGRLDQLKQIEEPSTVIHFLLGNLYSKEGDLSNMIHHLIKAWSGKLLKDASILEYFKSKNEYFVHDLVSIGNLLRGFIGAKESDVFYSEILKLQMNDQIVNRSTTVEYLRKKNNFKNYLEIGVFVGQNYLQVQPEFAVAVDPVPKIPKLEELPGHKKYYPIPSDDYFPELCKKDFPDGLDIVFIDGLHTYDQSLKDVINCLPFLNSDGWIIMHDCYPKYEAASWPSMEKSMQHPTFKGVWNGDVYKSILWLRSFRNDLEVCVLNKDHGLGIIRKKKPGMMLSFSEKEIKEMNYEFFEKKAHHYLNLKNVNSFTDLDELFS